MRFKKTVFGLQGTLLAALLVGCGGGSNGDFVAFVRGNLSGLGDGKLVALQNNGNADEVITLTQNGAFKFEKKLVIKEDYDVRVKNQPAGQVCVVTNGSGSINSRSEDVTNVLVTCK
jgi:hypothetical protein